MNLRCNIEPVFFLQPRTKSFGLEPGSWCVFLAKITKITEGQPVLTNKGLLRVVGCVPSLNRGMEYTLTADFEHNQ